MRHKTSRCLTFTSSMISLQPQTLPPSRYHAHPVPISGELKFSRTYLHNLESLLVRSPHPKPKIKEAFCQINKESNSSETFHSQSSSETSRISKQSQQFSRECQTLAAAKLSTFFSSQSSLRPKKENS